MRNLVLLVVILIVGIAFAGCQQWLSEEQVRNIVREEVTKQLASGQLKGIVGQEVTRQLASIDELTVSALYIKNEDGKIVGLLQSFGVMGGQLTFFDSDDNQVAQFNDSGLIFLDENQEHLASFGTLEDENGDRSGLIYLSNTDGEVTFRAP